MTLHLQIPKDSNVFALGRVLNHFITKLFKVCVESKSEMFYGCFGCNSSRGLKNVFRFESEKFDLQLSAGDAAEMQDVFN